MHEVQRQIGDLSDADKTQLEDWQKHLDSLETKDVTAVLKIMKSWIFVFSKPTIKSLSTDKKYPYTLYVFMTVWINSRCFDFDLYRVVFRI